MVLAPLAAALVRVWREARTAGVVALFRRAFDLKRIQARIWVIPVIFLLPGITVLSYGLMRLKGDSLPSPQISVWNALFMFLATFVAALAEELGWMGYAIDPLRKRWNALQAGLLLGAIWAAWHLVLLVQAGRSSGWIAWWCLYTVAARILIVWIYNNTHHSVFAAILFHAVGNMCTMLFPAYFNPQITGLAVAALAAVVTVIWGPRTLTRSEKLR